MEQAQQNNVDNVSMVSSDELINRNWKNEWNKLNKIMQTMSAWHHSDELINRNWKVEFMEQAQQNNADNVSMASSDEPINRNWKVEWNKLNTK